MALVQRLEEPLARQEAGGLRTAQGRRFYRIFVQGSDSSDIEWPRFGGASLANGTSSPLQALHHGCTVTAGRWSSRDLAVMLASGIRCRAASASECSGIDTHAARKSGQANSGPEGGRRA